MLLAFAPQVVSSPSSSISPSASTLPPLNAAVLAYCQNRVGKQVGNGQCAELPHMALRALKAMPRLKDAPNPGDYVWGKLVATITPKTIGHIARVLPGDVVQYRDVVFERRTPTFWSRSSASHHTSVVGSVREGVVTVFEQNVNGRMTVGTSDLTMADLKSGTLWVYRPDRVLARR